MNLHLKTEAHFQKPFYNCQGLEYGIRYVPTKSGCVAAAFSDKHTSLQQRQKDLYLEIAVTEEMEKMVENVCLAHLNL